MTNIIDLAPLYKHAQTDHAGQSIAGDSSYGRQYAKLVTNLVDVISDEPGFYLWGRYEPNGLWRTIYLGKAGLARTANLKVRIKEELKDERVFLWYGVLFSSKDEMIARCKELYPQLSPAGERHFRRAYRKRETTHIVWYPRSDFKDETEILAVEADLIETLNPSANSMRPAPNSSLGERTIEVIKAFRDAIHAARYGTRP